MNTAREEGKEERQEAPVFWQDKYSPAGYNPASNRGYREEIPALQGKNAPHSQKPHTVSVSAWIDQETDAYICERRKRSKNSDGTPMSRSKVVAQMLRERTLDEAFANSQAVIAPFIQETMRQERRIFENRYLKINARIAYLVGWTLFLLRRFVSILLSASPQVFAQIDEESERDARVFLSQRSGRLDDVEKRLREKLET